MPTIIDRDKGHLIDELNRKIGYLERDLKMYRTALKYLGEESDTERLVEGRDCPWCKTGKIIKRHGCYGDFLGCSRYPDCTWHESIPKE